VSVLQGNLRKRVMGGLAQVEWTGTRSSVFPVAKTQIYRGSANVPYAVGSAASWSFWVKRDSTQTIEAVVVSNYDPNTYNGFFVGVGELHLGPGSVIPVATFAMPTADTWVHVVYTYDGANVRVYHDGTLIDTVAYVHGAIGTSSREIWIGHDYPYQLSRATLYLEGGLRDVAIYNKVLNSTEITELYNSGNLFDLRTSSVADNILGYWGCGVDADDEDTIHDLTASRNHLVPDFKHTFISFVTSSDNHLAGDATLFSDLSSEFTTAIYFSPRSAGSISNTTFIGKDDRDGSTNKMFQFSIDYAYVWDEATGAYNGRQGTIASGINAGTNGAVKRADWMVMGYKSSDSPRVQAYWRGGEWGSDFSSGTFNSINNTASPVQFGGWLSGGSILRKIDGWMACIAVWNKKLTTAEVTEMANLRGQFDPRVNVGNYVSSTNLVHLWAAGQDAMDLTTSSGVPDLIGSQDLTGTSHSNTKIVALFSTDVP
jgi:hypothetical protein